MDRLTWAFNQTAFFDILRECVQYREPANFLLVRINEYNSLLRIHQYENLAQVRSNISEILRDTGTKREATVDVYKRQIVGSAIVRIVAQYGEQAGPKIYEYVSEMVGGLAE